MPARLENQTLLEEPGLGTKIGGGLVVGLRRDPLVRPVVDAIGSSLADMTPEDYNNLEYRLQNSRIAGVAELVGEYGPTLLAGTAAYSMGRAATVGVLGAAAENWAAKRTAQLIGGNVAVGLYQGASELAAGKTLPEAARSAALTALIGGGIEGATIGVGKLIAPRARIIDNAAEQISTFGSIAKDTRESLTPKGPANQVLALRSRLASLLDTQALDDELSLFIGPENKPTQKLTAISAKELLKENADRFPAVAAAQPSLFEQPGKFTSGLGPKVPKPALGEKVFVAPQRYLTSEVPPSEPVQEALFGTQATTEPTANILKGKSKADLTADRIRRLTRRLANRENLLQANVAFGNESNVIPTEITRSGPIQFGDGKLGQLNAAWQRALPYWGQTPDATAAKVGVSGMRLIDLAKDADVSSFVETQWGTKKIFEWAHNVADSVGRSTKNADDLKAVISDVLAAGEKAGTGIEGIRQKFGDTAASFMQEMGDYLKARYTLVQKMGGELLQTPEEMAKLGTAFYWPHVPQDLPEAKFVERMVAGLKKQGLSELEANGIADRIMRTSGQGLAKWGSIDFQRSIAGTLEEKIAAGMPFEDPLTGLLRHNAALTRRIQFGQRFGINGELRDTILNMAIKEGADRRLASSLIDDVFSRKVHDHAMRAFAQTVTSLETASKMTFGFLGNMAQTSNNAFVFGSKNALKGMMFGLRKTDPETLGIAANIMEDEFQAMRRVHMGIYRDSITDKIAQGSLFLFNPVEAFDRQASLSTANYSIRESVGKAIAGQLRGDKLEATTRLMGRLGINLPKVVQAAEELGPGNTDIIVQAIEKVHGKGAYGLSLAKGVQLTQFLPGKYQVPYLWDTPWGRIMTQFKRYGLLQGKLIRDQVIAEAARGNMKPLATIASIYPIAGELVADSVAALKNKDRKNSDGVLRLVDNVSSIGGFGIAWNAVSAAQYGNIQDVFLGPAVSDVFTLGNNVLSLNGGALMNQAAKMPVVQGATSVLTLGAESADQVKEWLNK